MTPADEPEQTAQKDKPKQSDADTGSVTITMPAEKAYYLQRVQVLEELQTDLLKWAKKRFWIITAIVVVFGVLGSGILIRETVRTLVDKQIAEANTAAILAKESATRATLATDEIIKHTQTYGKTVGVLQERATKVDAQFVAIQQRMEAESGNVKAGAARETKDIATRLARLESLVGGLAKQPQIPQKEVAAYEKEIAELKQAAFAEGKRFAENSDYYVTVYYNEKSTTLSTKVTEKLTEAGFKAVGYPISKLSIPSRVGFAWDRPGAPIDTTLPLKPTQLKPIEINTNRIIYGAGVGAEGKAKEIGELLRPLVNFSEVKMWSPDYPVDLFSPLIMYGLREQTKRLTVFIVG